MKIKLLFILILVLSDISDAQVVADFEDLELNPNSYWNGSDSPEGAYFTSANINFPNYFNPNFGGFWSDGWAYSNIVDTNTIGNENLYASFAGSGNNDSETYAIGQNNSKLYLSEATMGNTIDGVFISNGTYPALSMKNGDNFAKKFGGESGDDKDWFLLTIKNYFQGQLTGNQVEFYLADYRFNNNDSNYIIKDWEWIDLSELGNTDSLVFSLTSSDVGDFGMNTPGFFCLDDLSTFGTPTSSSFITSSTELKLYPNPAQNFITIEQKDNFDNLQLEILSGNGTLVHQSIINTNNSQINISSLARGVYFVRILTQEGMSIKKFIKK